MQGLKSFEQKHWNFQAEVKVGQTTTLATCGACFDWPHTNLRQPLQSMELRVKQDDNEKKDTGKLIKESPMIKDTS